MPNYRDINLDPGQYIPQYAGAPLDELRETGNVLANRHYENIARASQLQILQQQLKSQALEGAKPYFDQHIAGVQKALEEMARDGGENSTARINALATSFQGDQGMLDAMQRSKEVGDITKQIQEITNQTGREAVYHKDRLEAMKRASVYTTDANGNQVINPLYNSQFTLPVSPYLDPNTDFEKITANIKPNEKISQWLKGEDLVTVQSKFLKADGSMDVPKFVSYMTERGVSETKINELKKELLSAYKNTSSYKQQQEYFGKSDEEALNQILDYAKLGVFKEVNPRVMQVSGGTGRGSGSGEDYGPGNRFVLDPSIKVESTLGLPLPSDASALNPQSGARTVGPTGAMIGTYDNQTPAEKEAAKAEATQRQKNEDNMYNLMLEINGTGPYTKGDQEFNKEAFRKSEEGKKAIRAFRDEISKDILSQSYIDTYGDDDEGRKRRADKTDWIESVRPDLHYYDEKGKLIAYGSKEWNELTGGDAMQFRAVGELSPYNNRAIRTGEDAAATGMYQVTSYDKDNKKQKTFYVANPAEIDTEHGQARIRATAMYSMLEKSPGTFVSNPDGKTRTRLLVGEQKRQAWERHKQNLIDRYGSEENARIMFSRLQPPVELEVSPGMVILTDPVGASIEQPFTFKQ